MLGVGPAREGDPKRLGDLPALRVTYEIGCRADHHPQVAQIDLLDLRHSGVGAVSPLGQTDVGQEPLREHQQLRALDLGQPALAVRLVLTLDGLTHGREATAGGLLSHRTLLRRERRQNGIAVCAAGAEALGPRPFGSGRGRPPRTGRRGSGSALLAALAAGGITAGTALTPIITRAPPGAGAPAGVASVTVALPVAVSIAIAAPCATLGYEGRRHELVGLALTDQLDRLVTWSAEILRRDHRDDVYAVEGVGVLDAQDVTHLRGGVEHGGVQLTLWLAGTGLAPRPRIRVALAGEFDVHSERHAPTLPAHPDLEDPELLKTAPGAADPPRVTEDPRTELRRGTVTAVDDGFAHVALDPGPEPWDFPLVTLPAGVEPGAVIEVPFLAGRPDLSRGINISLTPLKELDRRLSRLERLERLTGHNVAIG